MEGAFTQRRTFLETTTPAGRTAPITRCADYRLQGRGPTVASAMSNTRKGKGRAVAEAALSSAATALSATNETERAPSANSPLKLPSYSKDNQR